MRVVRAIWLTVVLNDTFLVSIPDFDFSNFSLNVKVRECLAYSNVDC